MAGVVTLYHPPRAEIDIVFVHGLNGGNVDRWTPTTVCSELLLELDKCHGRNLFLEQVPSASVHIWCCPARPSSPSQHQPIDVAAAVLICDLERHKLPSQSRPLVFVCHGFGTLVLMKALLIANLQRESLSIAQRTLQIIFLSNSDRQITEENDKTKEWMCIENKMPLGEDHVLDAFEDWFDISKAFERISSRYKTAYLYQEACIGSLAAHQSAYAECIWPLTRQEPMFSIEGSHYVRPQLIGHSRNCKDLFYMLIGIIRNTTRAQRFCELSIASKRSILRACTQQRSPGTCDWLYAHASYKTWLSTNGPSCLWVHGNPGSGKTMIATAVLKVLENHRPLDGIVISFFDEGFGYENLAEACLTSLTNQLREHLIQVPAWSTAHHCNHWLSTSSTTFRQRLFSLFARIDGATQVTLVLDGLENQIWMKNTIVEATIRSNFRRSCSARLRCIIYSRTAFDYSGCSDQVISINLSEESGVSQDIYRFTTSQMTAKSWFSSEKTNQQEDLAKQVCLYANGMFLWVDMVMEQVTDPESLREIMQNVPSVPSHIEHLCRQAVQNISSSDHDVAQTIFLWLSAAYRPLRVSELLVILSIQVPRSSRFAYKQLIDGNLSAEQLRAKIQRMCGSLLRVTDEGFIKFRHASIRNYLLSQHGHDRPRCNLLVAHELLAHTCLLLLESEGNRVFTPLDHGVSWGCSDNRSTLLDYAYTYWSVHCRIAEPYSKILPGILQHSFGVTLNKMFDNNAIHTRSRSAAVNHAALRICAYHGFRSLVQIYLEMGVDVDCRSCLHCETPLYLAAAAKHPAIVEVLLQRGASIEPHVYIQGKSALLIAAAQGCAKTVMLLLKYGAQPQQATSGSSLTPLHIAASHGNTDVVKILMDCDININATTADTNETALHFAAAQGHMDVARYLLDGRRATLSETELYDFIVQQPYFRSWSENLLTHLGKNGRFVWEVDARCSAEDDLKMLILNSQRYADLSICTRNGRTALHHAASNGHDAIVQLLLERGADPTGGENCQLTALRVAAENGHMAVVRLLLTASDDTIARCKDLGAAVERVVENGHQAVADSLIWQAFGLEIIGKGFDRPLLCLATESKLNVAKNLLFQKRADGGTLRPFFRKRPPATTACTTGRQDERRAWKKLSTRFRSD